MDFWGAAEYTHTAIFSLKVLLDFSISMGSIFMHGWLQCMVATYSALLVSTECSAIADSCCPLRYFKPLYWLYVPSWVTKVCTMELITHCSCVSATPLPAILWVRVLLWTFQRDPWVLSTPSPIPVYGHKQVVYHEAAHQESCPEQPVGQASATIHTSASEK